MYNAKIREALKIYKIRQWRLAELLGVSEGTLCRRLRSELPNDEQNAILRLIISEASKQLNHEKSCENREQQPDE